MDSGKNYLLFSFKMIIKRFLLPLLITTSLLPSATESAFSGINQPAAEQMLSSILRSAPSGIGVVKHRVITNVNDYIINLTGYTKSELVGNSAIILYPDKAEYDYVGKEKYRQIAQSGTGSVETVWKRKDGTLINVILSSTPLNQNDLSEGVVFTVLDITDKKRSEETLKKRTLAFQIIMSALIFIQLSLIIVLIINLKKRKIAESDLLAKAEELDRFFSYALDLLCIADTNGNFIRINKEWENTLGYTEKELMQKKFLELVHPDDFEMTLKAVEKLSKQDTILNFINRYRCKDGSYRHIEWRSTPKGNVIYAAARDITERIKAESEREKFSHQLDRIQKLESLGVLASGIAHDFNNLLGGIFGYIDLAYQKSKNDTTIGRYLSSALGTIDRARALTRQLLTFAKGGLPVKRVESLLPFIEETVKFAMSGSNISCTYSLPEDLWLCSYDKNQMSQVVDNIVINAMQAMPNGGEIRVSARNITVESNFQKVATPGNYVKISISDCGIGIPKEIIPRIFDPFYSTKPKGHGLGLATCHSIIRKHGGFIEVESEVAKGTTFHIYLPASNTPAQTEDHPVSSITHTGTGTFIVMDDEDTLQKMIGGMLESFGYSVILTSNGDDATRFFQSELHSGHKVAGIILDLTVPVGMGGKAAVVEIRKISDSVPVYVASGSSDDPVMYNPVSYGFTGSICKPFKLSDLAELLNSVKLQT